MYTYSIFQAVIFFVVFKLHSTLIQTMVQCPVFSLAFDFAIFISFIIPHISAYNGIQVSEDPIQFHGKTSTSSSEVSELNFLAVRH